VGGFSLGRKAGGSSVSTGLTGTLFENAPQSSRPEEL
jgi:hypothetical protein